MEALNRISQLGDEPEPVESDSVRPTNLPAWIRRQRIFQRSTQLLEPPRLPPEAKPQQLLFPGAAPDPLFRPNENALVVDYFPGGVEADCVRSLSVTASRNLDLRAELAQMEDHMRSLAAQQRLQQLDLAALEPRPPLRAGDDDVWDGPPGADADTAPWLAEAERVQGTLKSLWREETRREERWRGEPELLPEHRAVPFWSPPTTPIPPSTPPRKGAGRVGHGGIRGEAWGDSPPPAAPPAVPRRGAGGRAEADLARAAQAYQSAGAHRGHARRPVRAGRAAPERGAGHRCGGGGNDEYGGGGGCCRGGGGGDFEGADYVGVKLASVGRGGGGRDDGDTDGLALAASLDAQLAALREQRAAQRRAIEDLTAARPARARE
jgi:hypothetical protein